MTHIDMIGMIATTVVLITIAVLASRILKQRVAYPYVSCESLLSKAERSVFGVLSNAIGDQYRIFAKVRLIDVIKPEPHLRNKQRYAAINRVISKHVDFVLCEPGTLNIVGVIELDDKSHRSNRRGVRDRFIDAALAGAGIPVLHLEAKRGYNPQAIRADVLAAFRDLLVTKDAPNSDVRAKRPI